MAYDCCRTRSAIEYNGVGAQAGNIGSGSNLRPIDCDDVSTVAKVCKNIGCSIELVGCVIEGVSPSATEDCIGTSAPANQIGTSTCAKGIISSPSANEIVEVGANDFIIAQATAGVEGEVSG